MPLILSGTNGISSNSVNWLTPPITDYLDGVVKGDQAQIDAYVAACQAVKDKYPKPEGV
jgi:hypothetical protein